MAINSDFTDEELVGLVVSGKIKPYELDELDWDRATKIRHTVYEKMLGLSLHSLGNYSISPSKCKPNIENMIGAVQVPLGIAGPVKMEGKYAKGEYHLPLATTEGTLVASVNRGCSVINASGGASAIAYQNRQARSILFRTRSIKQSEEFVSWVKGRITALKNIGNADEKFMKVLDIETYALGTNVWIRVIADTKDAMGMNMVTIAGKKIADHIIKNFDVEFLSESGNMCIDKKPSALALINGKGRMVTAEVMIPDLVVEKNLKTTSEKLIDLNYRKNLLGSGLAGSYGFNAHFANIVAAMYLATGQDMAHVVDGSIGFTTVEKADKGVLFGVTLSSIQVGTVGGGTGIATQHESQRILGTAGPGNPPGANASRLAEIIGVAVLAGEISLLGALCAHQLSSAHIKHNR